MKNFKIQIQVRKNGNKDSIFVNDQLCELKIRNGIVSIENGSTGSGHSIYPNIDKTGSVRGMKSRGYWGKNDTTVRSGGCIYNTSKVVVSDELDFLAWLIQRRVDGFRDETSIDPVTMSVQELDRLTDKTVGFIGKIIDNQPVVIQSWTGYRPIN